MITAVEEARLQHRQSRRSVASGPEFSVPAMPAIADSPPSDPAPTTCFAPQAAVTPAASLDLTNLLGRSVGTGQCVALVRAAQPTLGPSAAWQPGAAVRGNTALQPGTPIATFTPSDRYANATDGSSHAAIYLGQDQSGLHVLDQWSGSPAAIRTIPWTNPGATQANTGTAFRLINT